jgi:predicted RNA-binding Zn-ribbon protein involved in translation (DUF1610 family)
LEIDRRPYKVKNAVLKFLCPLCGVERGISVHYKLTMKNHLQIGIISIVLGLIGYSFLSWGVILFYPTVLVSFEFVRRSVYRKEIPCPHCGFDAVWYKKDVPKAKQLIHEFWSEKTEQADPLPNENSDT